MNMSGYRNRPQMGMFPRGRGARGQMMPRFPGPERNLGAGGPSPYFLGPSANDNWGCPVGSRPPQFVPEFRPRGPPPFGWRGPRPNHFHPRNQSNFPRHKGPWQNQNMNGNQMKNKKNAVPKRDLAENNKFFCDICDRGFKTEELHKVHTDSHEKCSVDGCSYTAAPKLVQLHYKLQHKTGLAKKIWLLESKEDLEKWRQERKKNFPTAANIERKSVAMADKVSRGEVLETKSFGKFKNNKFSRGRGRGRGGANPSKHTQPASSNGSAQKRSHDQTPKVPTNENSQKRLHSEPDQSSKKTKLEVSEELSQKDGQDPLSIVLAGISGSDEELEQGGEKIAHDTSDLCNLSAGGLGNLISSYASDSGEDETNVKTKPTTQSNTGGAIQNKNSNRKRKRGRKGKQNENNVPNVNQSTLLEKMLAPDIRHERNVILQCIRYIMKKDFFGQRNQGQKSSIEGRSLCITKQVDEEIWESGHVTETLDS